MAATMWIFGILLFLISLISIFLTYFFFFRISKSISDEQDDIQDIDKVLEDNNLKLSDEISDLIMDISFELRRLNLVLWFVGSLVVETLGVLIGSLIIYMYRDSWVAQLFF